MLNINISQLLSDDKDIAAMQQPEILLVQSKPNSPDSSPLSPQNQSQTHQNHHHQQDQEPEQEKLQDGSIRKRKWECDGDGEDSGIEITERTPTKSKAECYCLPKPPRKPKATPAMKGRAMWLKRSVVLMDVAKEVESMFPSSVLQDFGKKIKKARS